MDRFIIVEMDVLTSDEEHGLLTYMFPHVDSDLLKSMRYPLKLVVSQSRSWSGVGISTRTSVELDYSSMVLVSMDEGGHGLSSVLR